ncbi:MAG TPA: hypothetical protein VFH39_02195 [Candidatus Saccharimonadales bacterium]|nr:hypothetical protein [Candidatus Saccharimonadales bacterium]
MRASTLSSINKANRSFMTLIRQLPSGGISMLAAVFLIGAVGSYYLFTTHAATPTASVQTESGTVTSPALTVGDTSASGSHAVKFAKAATSGTALHYAGNSNFGANGQYLPGAYGFNLADVGSVSDLTSLPAGVKGLAWVGQCNGADATFTNTVKPYIGHPKLFGFYLMDEPDATGQWAPKCPIANLKAESDWIHANVPGAKTFIISLNMASSSNPSYAGTYNSTNSDIDLFGLDPYPCRTELSGCDYTYITKAVPAAVAAGINKSAIVPVYQTFGLGKWVDDGGSTYAVPTATQAQKIIDTWASVVPNPVFDYAYSWGSQNSDTALESMPAVQQVFLAHNTQ